MNWSNIWEHPKTTVLGILVLVVTICGVLVGNGVMGAPVGTTTWVALISALAAALIGLLSRDWGTSQSASKSSDSTTLKLGAWALIALLGPATMVPMTGCTQQQRITVAQEIVNLTPAAVSAVNTALATASLLDPAAASIFSAATTGFDTLAQGLKTMAADYLANPNQTTLALLQSGIVKFQQSVNTSLLQVAGIKNTNSQQIALVAINGIATIINTVLGLVQSISTKTQVAAMAAQVHVTLAQVRPLLDQRGLQASAERVSSDLALSRVPSVDEFFGWEAQRGF